MKPASKPARAFGSLIVLSLVSSALGAAPDARASAHRMPVPGAPVLKGRWDGSNDPRIWEPAEATPYEFTLSRLPLAGEMASHRPWSDTYWPTNHAGISTRWNWPGQSYFKYRFFSEAEIRAMSAADLARLSPAEKYDIFMGRFDYPTARAVRGGTRPSAEYWQGICHGWAPAALNHPEPAPVTVTGPGGVAVPFGSADVKGLLDQYYADHEKPSYFLGLKCQYGSGGSIFRRIANPFLRGAACDDVNAGALHLILTNELGIRKKGFIADVDPLREVWNQPVYGFSSSITGEQGPSRGAAYGTVREVIVHTEMFYADEIDATWEPVVGTPKFKGGVGKYDYRLELDAQGRIVGGAYIGAERPDFLWKGDKLEFTGYDAGLNEIYRPATPPAAEGPAPVPTPDSTPAPAAI